MVVAPAVLLGLTGGAFPICGSCERLDWCGIRERTEHFPSTSLVERSEEEHSVSIVFMPEDSSALKAKVHDPTDGAFHRAAAHRQASSACDVEFEAVSVADEVALFRIEFLALAAGASRLDGGDELVDAPLLEETSLFADPLLSVGSRPAGSQRCQSAKVFDRMVEIEELEDLSGVQRELGDQGLETVPDPTRPIGDEQHSCRALDVELTEVVAQELPAFSPLPSRGYGCLPLPFGIAYLGSD